MQSYVDKSETYFSHARMEIAPLLPKVSDRVLEIGCGSGATMRWLRQSGRALHTVGVEIAEMAAEQALQHIDEVYCLDFEQAELSASCGSFDLILCLDVLEHMIDPWSVVNRLVTRYLNPNGTIIVSLPNVRHYSIVLPLLLKGSWKYEEAGLLDRTHLRFFTRATAYELLAHRQLLPVLSSEVTVNWKSRKGIFNLLTVGIFRDLLTYQYCLAACKKPRE
jgi:2-polyprenyl-3-methyl-5-hydroxy-6-metoxy-1,4-benzoquinol methylase